MKNWKTLMGGVVAAIGTGLIDQPGLLHTVGLVLLAAGTFFTGAYGKDFNVSGKP